MWLKPENPQIAKQIRDPLDPKSEIDGRIPQGFGMRNVALIIALPLSA
jgi:hypothetical protein